MCKPRGSNGLLKQGRTISTLQPSRGPHLAQVLQLLSEMGKLLRQIRDEVQGLQRRTVPQPPPEMEKPEELEVPKDQPEPPTSRHQ